jgi:hypothetical protein
MDMNGRGYWQSARDIGTGEATGTQPEIGLSKAVSSKSEIGLGRADGVNYCKVGRRGELLCEDHV